MDRWTIMLKAITWAILLLACVVAAAADGKPAVDYTKAVASLDQAIDRQMARFGIRGIAVALVDDQRVVHVAGHGAAKPESVFRAGSISKVFNAVAIMQLVEQGKLDLDAPIRRYGPQFATINPFGDAPVTLRQILCHRSGMVRESPVGGYLDGSQPSLAATVASARDCPLLNPPNTKTRYSNIAPSVAGEVLVTVAGVPYERYQKKHVLGPLGMSSSSFLLDSALRPRFLVGGMRIADGRGGFTHGDAPLFELGTLPAGNLYTTAGDLAKFLTMLAADGGAAGKQILAPKSLAEMTTPQLITGDTGFGLGFSVGKFRSHKSIGHMGAVYGHTSSFVFLPQLKLGVVLLSNEDIATGPLRKLTNEALSLLVESKTGEKPPQPGPPQPGPPQPGPAPSAPRTLSAAEAAALCGHYESQSHWAVISSTPEGKLFGNIATQTMELTPVSPHKLLADGRIFDAAPLEFHCDAQGRAVSFTALEQKFTRVDPHARADVPPLWAEYAGVYGPAFIPLVISVRHGHLYATVENELDYRLAPATRNVFVLPPGMYREEHLVFLTSPEGKVHGVRFGNMYLKRQR